MTLIAIFLAVLLDWLIGDPYSWPHPVKWIGSYIYLCMRLQEKRQFSPYLFGFFLWLTTVGLALVVTYGLLWLAGLVHPVLYWIVWIYLAYASLAAKSLAFEAQKVYQTLKFGSLEEARKQVGMIVGRETSQLTPEEISKATIETVAENTSDGVIGPLLCLFLGGPILAMTYKAINTLDSMVGYKTEKYRKIGLISAKMDDLANLIPARLTWLFLILSSQILLLDFKGALRIGWRDRYQHASPNSAFSEAVVAGALGIQLGGPHVYHGELTIEEKSFQIIQSTITEKDPDYVFHSEMEESIIKRAIHTTGDFDYLYTMRFEHDVLKKIEEVIRAKGTILLDSNISLNGINKRVLDQLGVSYRCLISDEEVVELAKEKQITRAMAAVEIAAKIEGPKVFAFGGAPTALSYLIELAEQGLVEPDAVIGVPVGFINVEESKEELLQSGLPALVNLGRKGGSTIVVAIINAIIYQLREVVTDDYVRYSTPSSKEGGKN